MGRRRFAHRGCWLLPAGRDEAETTELLAAGLPDRVVDQVRSGDSDVAEAVQNATVNVLAVDEPATSDPVAQQMIVDHGVELAAALGALADEHRGRAAALVGVP